VTVFALEDRTLLLADGYHRVAAAQHAGRSTIQAEVRPGTKAQAIQFAVDLARAERGVSAEQAREAIRRYSGGDRRSGISRADGHRIHSRGGTIPMTRGARASNRGMCYRRAVVTAIGFGTPRVRARRTV
jgi:hypothetical protein